MSHPIPPSHQNHGSALSSPQTIDSFLDTECHLGVTCGPFSIGIIARIRHFVPLNTLQHIYRSLIQPYLLYGITTWGRADKIHRNKILCLQKRALRLMFFGDYRAHAVPFFISSSLLPLDLLYFKSVAVLIIYKQQFLHTDWLRACQLIPNQCKKVKLSAKS